MINQWSKICYICLEDKDGSKYQFNTNITDLTIKGGNFNMTLNSNEIGGVTFNISSRSLITISANSIFLGVNNNQNDFDFGIDSIAYNNIDTPSYSKTHISLEHTMFRLTLLWTTKPDIRDATEEIEQDSSINTVLTSVLKYGVKSPPSNPKDGDRYIVGINATSSWAGQDNNIAQYSSASGWLFTTPNTGDAVFSIQNNESYLFNGTKWHINFNHYPALRLVMEDVLIDSPGFDFKTFLTKEITFMIPPFKPNGDPNVKLQSTGGLYDLPSVNSIFGNYE